MCSTAELSSDDSSCSHACTCTLKPGCRVGQTDQYSSSNSLVRLALTADLPSSTLLSLWPAAAVMSFMGFHICLR